MTTRFFLPHQPQSGKNAIQINPKTYAHYPKKRFVEWRTAMFAAINLQGVRPTAPLTCDVHMTVHYSQVDKRRRDVTGILDAIFHVVERSGILADDTQVKSVTWVPAKASIPGVWVQLDDYLLFSTPPWEPDPAVLAVPDPQAKKPATPAAKPRSRAKAAPRG